MLRRIIIKRSVIEKRNSGIVDKDRLKLYMNITPSQYEKFTLSQLNKNTNNFERNIYAGCILGETHFIKKPYII